MHLTGTSFQSRDAFGFEIGTLCACFSASLEPEIEITGTEYEERSEVTTENEEVSGELKIIANVK